MNTDLKLKITDIQRFCMHDGPGIRTTVFLKGCPLRCAWCHNPETQKGGAELLFYSNKCIACGGCSAVCPTGAHELGERHVIDRTKCDSCAECVSACPTGALELCGADASIEEILSVVERDRSFYGERGGVTLSGGEPLAQGQAAVELLRAAKERGLGTALETCGFADPDVLRSAAPFVDLFLWDVKDTDAERHKKYTGVSNRQILENLALVDSIGKRVRLRCILVNGVNTDEEHYRGIARLALSLSCCEGVEFIPYHAYAGTKSVFIGAEDSGRAEWIPGDEEIGRAKRVVGDMGINVF